MSEISDTKESFELLLDRETTIGAALFAEPWHAQAFALTVALHQKGVFAWTDWTEFFSSEIANFERDGREDYFLCWLTALEKLLISRGVTGQEDLSALARDWKAAYLRTPHGQPVALTN